jgi:phosphatidate cytidylyltransferase
LPPELAPSDGASFGRWIGVSSGIVFGLVTSIAAQLGDLLESCFKRDAGFKDSGKVIPRFGGILDLVDSPVLAMPVAWLLLTW